MDYIPGYGSSKTLVSGVRFTPFLQTYFFRQLRSWTIHFLFEEFFMKAQIISFHCVLKNGLGQIINRSFTRDVITHVAGASPAIPGLPDGLKNVKPGERRKISVKAQEAFGMYDPALARQASRKSLAPAGTLTLGDRVQLADSFGDFRLYRVTKIIGDLIYLDANHPLAGQDLTFDVHVVDARDASPEELLESSVPAIPTFLQ